MAALFHIAAARRFVDQMQLVTGLHRQKAVGVVIAAVSAILLIDQPRRHGQLAPVMKNARVCAAALQTSTS